jgi:hypothetical protein
MDVTPSPMFAKPGTARLAYNYEWSPSGGLRRLDGLDAFDGRTAPSSAAYVIVECLATVTGVSVGNTLTGVTSAATGKVIYVSGKNIAMTQVTGTFALEVLNLSGSPVATISSLAVSVDGFLDNVLLKSAADVYQALITKVPGSGPIRGVAILNDIVYAWRNNAGGTAAAIYKSSGSGWTLVDLGKQLSFTAGLAAGIVEGNTVTGATSGATGVVSRVVVESGTFAAGTAAGRLILSSTTGTFQAAENLQVAGTNRATCSGAQADITLSPGGRVQTDRYNFTASLNTVRVYGCDGINAEFEFDGTVYVPLTTGMGSVRAQAVRCHKKHLFFGYRGSLQHSSIANPYVYSAVTGAAELGTGDEITNLISVGGATDAAALMVLCRDALFVLYGNSSADWNLVPLSKIQGAQRYSAQDIGGVVALDTPGIVSYPASQNFGNFDWNTVSMQIQNLVRQQSCVASVYVPGVFKYRMFFADGTAVSGLPIGPGKFLWSVINYGRSIVVAEQAEIAGIARTFYGDDQGWVYEADKGRSFAGDPVQCLVRLHQLSQRSPAVEKLYRQMQLEVRAESACTLYTFCEFNEEEGASQQQTTPQYGAGAIFDLTNYDESYYGVAEVSRKTVTCEGTGRYVTLTLAGESDNERPHTFHGLTLLYTPRKLGR